MQQGPNSICVYCGEIYPRDFYMRHNCNSPYISKPYLTMKCSLCGHSILAGLKHDCPALQRKTTEGEATMTDTTAGGIKHDSEKARMDLLSSSWIEGTSAVLTFGAKKYASHNWRKGIERSRLMGAALRHLFAYNNGEDYDKETGLLHLYHASCCLMFASELHFTRPDLDDRYKQELSEKQKEDFRAIAKGVYGSEEHKKRYGSSSGSGETKKTTD